MNPFRKFRDLCLILCAVIALGQNLIAQDARPVITAVTNAASGVSGLVPGAVVSIFGTNLSNGSTSAPDGCHVKVVVTHNGIPSDPVVLNSPLDQPGIVTVNGIDGAVFHSATNRLVTASEPAAKGEIVSIYATGLAIRFFEPLPAIGVVAPVESSCEPARRYWLRGAIVGGKNAEVLSSCVVPGLIGVTQTNVRIPEDAPSGIVDIKVTSALLTMPIISRPAHIWIQ
jgi:hypothetical protein